MYLVNYTFNHTKAVAGGSRFSVSRANINYQSTLQLTIAEVNGKNNFNRNLKREKTSSGKFLQGIAGDILLYITYVYILG